MKALPLFDLTGKKALVTGGATGIGRACATALAMGGTDVAIVDLDERLGQKTVACLQALGVQSFFVHCDVSDPVQVSLMIENVGRTFGRLDIAINNAGVGVRETRDESLSKREWDRLMAINLDGLWCCAQAEA